MKRTIFFFNIKQLLSLTIALLCLASFNTAYSSVIITGTRVIYHSNAKEVSLQLTNPDEYPNVMQVWADINNPQSDPETADAPFVITPPLFRIEPKAGQSVRIIFTGADLPQDRESIFYLNTLQIPPTLSQHKEENQVMLMLRNRLKLFYRPTTIVGKPTEITSKLTFTVQQEGQDWVVNAENPTSFYATLTNGTVVAGEREHTFTPEMIAPFSKASWKIPKAGNLPQKTPLKVQFILVDDYGASISGAYEIKRQ